MFRFYKLVHHGTMVLGDFCLAKNGAKLHPFFETGNITYQKKGWSKLILSLNYQIMLISDYFSAQFANKA